MIASDPLDNADNVGQWPVRHQGSGASRRITPDAALWA